MKLRLKALKLIVHMVIYVTLAIFLNLGVAEASINFEGTNIQEFSVFTNQLFTFLCSFGIGGYVSKWLFKDIEEE